MIALLRLLTLRPCREPFCSARLRCWRWHVETFTCPTCRRQVSEYDPAFLAGVNGRLGATGVNGLSYGQTWAFGGPCNYTLSPSPFLTRRTP